MDARLFGVHVVLLHRLPPLLLRCIQGSPNLVSATLYGAGTAWSEQHTADLLAMPSWVEVCYVRGSRKVLSVGDVFDLFGELEGVTVPPEQQGSFEAGDEWLAHDLPMPLPTAPAVVGPPWPTDISPYLPALTYSDVLVAMQNFMWRMLSAPSGAAAAAAAAAAGGGGRGRGSGAGGSGRAGGGGGGRAGRGGQGARAGGGGRGRAGPSVRLRGAAAVVQTPPSGGPTRGPVASAPTSEVVEISSDEEVTEGSPVGSSGQAAAPIAEWFPSADKKGEVYGADISEEAAVLQFLEERGFPVSQVVHVSGLSISWMTSPCFVHQVALLPLSLNVCACVVEQILAA